MTFSISNSIKTARETFAHLNNDGLTTSIGDVWSIKKILLLDYYMPSFLGLFLVQKVISRNVILRIPFVALGFLQILWILN